MKTLCGLCLALFLCAQSAWAGEATNFLERAFPPADKGMVRFVLDLPERADASACQVELLVGKMVETEGDNDYWFDGKVEAVNIEGWPYPRYIARPGSLRVMYSLVGWTSKPPKINKFVTIKGIMGKEYDGSEHHFLIRYSSGAPVVVYVPEGFQVRYRLWRAEPEMKLMNKG
jgi:ecotin